MAKLAKNFVAHERMPKKTSQGKRKGVRKQKDLPIPEGMVSISEFGVV